MTCQCYLECYEGSKCFTCLEKLEDKACVWLATKGIMTTNRKTVLCQFPDTYEDGNVKSVDLPATVVAKAMGWNEWSIDESSSRM